MAQRNADGTVTMKTRGSLSYTPSGSGGSKSASKVRGGTGRNGRLTALKGQTVSPKSTYA